MNFKRNLTYWFPKIIGIIILTFQLYKYLTNTIINYTEEGVITVIGVAFFLNLRWILDFTKARFTNNQKPEEYNEE